MLKDGKVAAEFMVSPQVKALEQVQRVQIESESHPTGKRVKIRVESFDECLGWYTSGSLSLPVHQLPLLEQALSAAAADADDTDVSDRKVIAFPGLVAQPLDSAEVAGVGAALE